jgi:hypothetical protein
MCRACMTGGRSVFVGWGVWWGKSTVCDEELLRDHAVAEGTVVDGGVVELAGVAVFEAWVGVGRVIADAGCD